MSAGIKGPWAAWSAAYAARNQREKVILAAAVLAVAYALTDAFWLTPSINAYKTQSKALQQKQADLADLVRKTQELAEMERAKTAQLDSALKTVRTDSTDVASKLAEFERTLVPAQRMPQLASPEDQGLSRPSLNRYTYAWQGLSTPSKEEICLHETPPGAGLAA